jgi:hypothetical protein
MCSCILLILVAYFCLVHHLNSIPWFHDAHLLIDCSLEPCLHFVFFCVGSCLDNRSRQWIDDYFSIVQHVSANQHVYY